MISKLNIETVFFSDLIEIYEKYRFKFLVCKQNRWAITSSIILVMKYNVGSQYLLYPLKIITQNQRHIIIIYCMVM